MLLDISSFFNNLLVFRGVQNRYASTLKNSFVFNLSIGYNNSEKGYYPFEKDLQD